MSHRVDGTGSNKTNVRHRLTGTSEAGVYRREGLGNVDSDVVTLQGPNAFEAFNIFQEQVQSTVATGLPPFIVASDTQVLKLNSSKLEGFITGTSGNKIALMDGANSWSGVQTLASPVLNGSLSGSAFLDDNSFGTADQVTVSSTTAIKTYVDTEIAASVTSSGAITDHSVVRGDGGARGIQGSGVLLDDSDNMSAIANLDITGVLSLTDTDTGFSVISGSLFYDVASTKGHAFRVNNAVEASLIADRLTFNNGAIETSIDFDVSGELGLGVGGIKQVNVTNGAFVPETTNDIDLGTSSLLFKDAYFAGSVHLTDVNTGFAALSGELLYDVATGKRHIFRVNNIEQIVITDSSIEPITDGDIALGDLAGVKRFKEGSFSRDVTARKFISVIPSGNPPLIVASTDRVPNLNADTVDGIEAAALLRVDGSLGLSADWDAGSFEIQAATFFADTGVISLTDADTGFFTVGGSLFYDVALGRTHTFRIDNSTEMTLSAGGLNIVATCRAAGFRADTNAGGLAGTTTYCHAYLSPGAGSAATMAIAPTGYTQAQDIWLEVKNETTEYVIPLWKKT